MSAIPGRSSEESSEVRIESPRTCRTSSWGSGRGRGRAEEVRGVGYEHGFSLHVSPYSLYP